MPEVALSFRAVCGGFVPVYMNFMYRRTVERKSLFIRTLKLRRLQDSVVVGFLLAYLYLGVFLHRCGDVELNPGPGPSGKADNLRQTRMMSSGGGTSASTSSPSRTSGLS
ncbi:uncharacterized protein LOC143280390 [Babylonia areolata]|uniref:uncharacterized protein LOC143280390 n=1 Tax=Babylonia areolata TaxID=304850 RepID=UPI003FD32F6A